MGRNYGLGSRDIGRAGRMALNAAARRNALSFSTAATVGKRWTYFCRWAKTKGIKQMEKIMPETAVCFGFSLAEQVHDGEMAPSTAQNYLSAVNTVMSIATNLQWASISPTRDCGIPKRTGIVTVSQAFSQAEHDCLITSVNSRIAAILDLQRYLGLRFEESAKLNAVAALAQARTSGQLSITAGTKGGLARIVPASPAAISALEQAAEIQAGDRSMIPRDLSYVAFQYACYRELRRAGGTGFHGERHFYAQNRYHEITGAPPPVGAGWSRAERFERLAERLGISPTEAVEFDYQARLQVARALGHRRTEITNAYLG